MLFYSAVSVLIYLIVILHMGEVFLWTEILVDSTTSKIYSVTVKALGHKQTNKNQDEQ